MKTNNYESQEQIWVKYKKHYNDKSCPSTDLAALVDMSAPLEGHLSHSLHRRMLAGLAVELDGFIVPFPIMRL